MPSALQSVTWNLGRELWPQTDIYEELLKESPFLGMVKKDTSFGEDVRHIAVGTGMPQGAGPVFQTAKGNKTASLADVFQIRAKTYYSVFSILGRLLRQAKIDKAVIVKPYARESKNAILQWKRDISAYLFGNGGGSIGAFDPTYLSGAFLSGQTFKLKDTSKIRFFQRNMKLNTATGNDGTLAGTANTGSMTIAKIVKSGPNKGVITIQESSIAAAISGATINDFLFRDGVFANVPNGLLSWLPRADPNTSDPVTGFTVPGTFLGVDRTVDTEAYAGIRVDGTHAGGVFQAGMLAASALVDSSATPDLWIMSTTEWNNMRIEQSVAGTLVYTTTPASGVGKYEPGMDYECFVIKGPRGDIRVLADPDCPVGRSFMLMQETWTLASTGELVSLIESPMMEENQDSWESRFVGDLELYTEAPGFNATIQHSATA